MQRRDFMKLTGLGVGALALKPGAHAQNSNARPPNVVFMMSDELAYFELGHMGNPHLRTPTIDRFAADGIRFTQALAGSCVCAPTRCALMTGKHTGHTSVRKNDGGTPMRADEITIAALLKRAGYATGGFGKWGCGGRGSDGIPEAHGFDDFWGYYDQVHAHSYYPPYIIHNSDEVPLPGNRGGRSGETYSHNVIMERGLEFIRANYRRPFFCYLPITPPHGMYDIPDSDPSWAVFKDRDWPEEAARYAAMVHMVDRNLGQVLELLQHLEIDEQTIVFFCGDNGGQDRFRSPEHPRGFFGPNVNPRTGVAFRGGKGNLYEGGLRIPMLVRWPGHIAPGQVSDLLWYFPDVLPTVAELAGVTPPDDIDGISIVPQLLGPDTVGRPQPRHEFLYWEHRSQRAVRMNRWKAIQPKPDADWELYDLDVDLSEGHDVAAVHADVLAPMKAFAERAHEPAREGQFRDRGDHEKDRWAKWGTSRQGHPGSGSAKALPADGLLPVTSWTVVRVSSESRFNGRFAVCAFDGDPSTLWHTRFRDHLDRHPHELVLDLGTVCTVEGFRYLARQDPGWNGTIKDVEFFVSNVADTFGAPAFKGTLDKTKNPQECRCKAVRGRYIMLRALSEINGGPWASAAELGIIGTPVTP